MIKASNHLEETDVLVPEELAEAIYSDLDYKPNSL